MTAPPPDDTNPTERERSAAEIDAEFATIVASISDQMTWDPTAAATTGPHVHPGQSTAHESMEGSADQGAADQGSADQSVARDGAEQGADQGSADERRAAALERDRRRALRRAERAEEVAQFAAAQAESEAEQRTDDAHFTPPEPPPVPRPGRRTVVALLLMVLGLGMLIRPGLLQVTSDVVLLLAMICLVGGFVLLILGLRPRAADPDDADGWDDGARL